MIIDNNPIINETNRTIQVKSTINSDEEVSITINGAMAIHLEDIDSIVNDIITLVPGLDIDWSYDTFAIFYE